MEPIVLKSIEEETADCRAAMKNLEAGDLVNFCHHEDPLETLFQSPEMRITYILSNKAYYEQALRLRMFRPAQIPEELASDEEWKTLVTRLKKAMQEWNGFWLQKIELEKIPYATRTHEQLEKLDALRLLSSRIWDTSRPDRERLQDMYRPYVEQIFGIWWKGSANIFDFPIEAQND